MNPDSEPYGNISFPRNIKISEIDSKIINLNIVSRWIDKVDVNDKFSHMRELYVPHKFELLLRGCRCGNKPITVTFIKVKGTEEIIGGYNPSIWKPSKCYGKTKHSFICSFKNKDNFKDAIISNVDNMDNALLHGPNYGLCFGWKDFDIYGSNESQDFTFKACRKRIRVTENQFSIEDYEVFQML